MIRLEPGVMWPWNKLITTSVPAHINQLPAERIEMQVHATSNPRNTPGVITLHYNSLKICTHELMRVRFTTVPVFSILKKLVLVHHAAAEGSEQVWFSGASTFILLSVTRDISLFQIGPLMENSPGQIRWSCRRNAAVCAPCKEPKSLQSVLYLVSLPS